MNTTTLISPAGTKTITISEKNTEHTISIDNTDENNNDFNLTVHATAESENTSITIVGRFEAKKNNKKKIHISLFLHGKNQSGTIDLKGVSDENAFIEFNGGGIIEKNSENCTMNIVQKIFLFSKKAKAKAIPVLRVETDNVQSASHSASIAPFSKDIYFFMETRGISKDDAKIILKNGILQ